MTDPTSYLGWKIDFAHPAGEPALLEPDSVQWRVFKNTVALGIGGVAAVLMEFADPRIRSGVWDYSTFSQDPVGRARRTGTAAMVGVYGPQSAARRVIQGVTNMHARVAGRTPSGEAYAALDPELLDWVAATAGYGFLVAYDRFVTPLSETDKARFFEEGETVARLYGAQRSPKSTEGFVAMGEALAHRFEPHPIIDQFLAIIADGGVAPAAPKALHRALTRAAVSILPPVVADRLSFGPQFDLTAADRLMLRTAGRLAERVPLRGSPPCQASVRLGLPWNFLYLGEAAQRRALERRAA